MAAFTIFHNPRCSKSRQTLQLLQENGIEPTVVEYLKTPPSGADILKLAANLRRPVAALLRNKEDEYKALKLKEFNGSDAELADIVASHPKLLERPIVVRESDNEARIGRPPETVLELL
ncbi:MAG: arsenate reductase (glutaredoxin) [Aliidiomarina sp.]|uniref:arsenate reductase (glutaredoxin) n=1 Tax=Aliidiomarina sp. TaxID=1872439 RepID=UPI0025BEA6FF|nr:arsenate reductase (glutaredoxin) [Aliidiomarina sp.]MCH8501999.1 arsenate reductase (glutaredoxin) [Aliidiomarina sp.]